MLKKYIYTILFILFCYQGFTQNIIWADRVVSNSTQYSNKIFSAHQVLGKPNSLEHEESKVAWMPSRQNFGEESITVSYPSYVIPKSIIIQENLNPGSIYQVLVSNNEREWMVYENKKPSPSSKTAITKIINVDKVKEPINKVTVILNTAAVLGYNQIDAIGISASKIESYTPDINFIKNLYSKSPTTLGSNINSIYDDMLPMLSPDGNTLYFARKNAPENIGNKKNDDIYYSEWNPKKKQWNLAQNINSPLNNSFHNFVVSISPDSKTLYLSGTYEENSDRKGLSYSTYKNAKWAQPKSIDIKNYYNRSKYACYHIGVDQSVMVMALERDDTRGDMDVYVSFVAGENKWTEPINLGSTVNTAGIEASVFLAADGKTIYFSSDGHAGYGGLDMFMSKKLDNTWKNWSEPVNLGPQINTPFWDVYYTVSSSGEYAYFSSESNAIGGHDIFQIELPRELRPEPVTIVKANITIENNDKTSTSPKQEIVQQTTSIIKADEKPTSLYKSFKGYFPIETEIKDDKKVDKTYLKEEDDYKNIDLKTGEVLYKTEGDKKLQELQLKLQGIRNEQSATNVKLEKYNPYALTSSPYQDIKKIDSEASKKLYNESSYISELEDKLNKLKSTKNEIASTNAYSASTRLATIPKKEVEIKEYVEPTTNTTSNYNQTLEELKAKRDAQQFSSKPSKSLKNIEYDPNDERIKYVPNETLRNKEENTVPDPEIEAYKKKLQEIQDRYLRNDLPEINEEQAVQTDNYNKETKDSPQKQTEKKKEIEIVYPVIEKEGNDELALKPEEKPIEKVTEKPAEIIVEKPAENKEAILLAQKNEQLLKENESIERANAKLLEDQKRIAAEKGLAEAEREIAEGAKKKMLEDKELLDKQIKELEIEKNKILAAKKSLEEEKLKLENLKRVQANEVAKLQKELATIQKEKGNTETFTKKPLEESIEVIKDISLLPLKVGAVFEIKNIFFNANSAILKEESYEELDKIVAFLMVNNNIAVEIGGHTNGLCTEDFCNQLSGNRSKVVMEYILAEGIENNRLSYKGYGKAQPLASNDTVDGRKKNQRVELKIMEIR